MFYPIGENTTGRTLICIDDEALSIEESIKEGNANMESIEESIDKWLDENNYCMEEWQLREYLEKKYKSLNEDGEGGSPGAGAATLGNVNGMGDVVAPTNDGTNSGFHNPAMNGSGDRFSSLGVSKKSIKEKGKKSKKKLVSYLEFVNRNK
jgi:hypothetical protein